MTPDQFKQVLAGAGRLDPEHMDRDQLLAEVKRLRAGVDIVVSKSAAAVEDVAAKNRQLQDEVKRLREQARVTKLVTEDEKNRAAYEARDAERRGWESRRAVENVHLAEVTRERDAALAHVRRLMGHRDQVARAVRSPNLTDAEKLTEIREAFAIVDGERVEAGEGR